VRADGRADRCADAERTVKRDPDPHHDGARTLRPKCADAPRECAGHRVALAETERDSRQDEHGERRNRCRDGAGSHGEDAREAGHRNAEYERGLRAVMIDEVARERARQERAERLDADRNADQQRPVAEDVLDEAGDCAERDAHREVTARRDRAQHGQRAKR
jgi:hypothetical protein